MSANRMHTLIQDMNPDRYDIAMENEIKQVVSSLVTDEKKKKVSAEKKRALEGVEGINGSQSKRARTREEDRRNDCDNDSMYCNDDRIEAPLRGDQRTGDEAGHEDHSVKYGIGRGVGAETVDECAESNRERREETDGCEILCFKPNHERERDENEETMGSITEIGAEGNESCSLGSSETGGLNATGGAETDRAKVSSAVWYSIPVRYVTYLRKVMEQDENVKRTEVRGRMIVAMGLTRRPYQETFLARSRYDSG